MSSKHALVLLKGIILIQIALLFHMAYKNYTDLIKTYDQGENAAWITGGVLLYWIIVGPILVWVLKDDKHRQGTFKLIGGITLFFMLGHLILLFTPIASERHIGELIRYAGRLMLCGLLLTYFIGMQVSGGWRKWGSRDKRRGEGISKD
jgi:hypothetical protein